MVSRENASARHGCRTRRRLIARSLTSFCAIGVLAAALAALAVLEYQWATTVSEASRERIQTSLKSALLEVRAEIEHQSATGPLRRDAFRASVGRYFNSGELTEYCAGVLSGPPDNELLYSSEAGLSARNFSEPDARLRLSALIEAAPYPPASQQQPRRRGLEGGADDRPVSSALLDSKPWMLVAKRQQGSLSDAVENIRLKCLAINFGVLLVLGLGTAMLVVSALRARTFLRLQMEFVASVSHELRTPLSVIGSAADNLAEGVVRSDQNVREYGSLIRGECRRLSGLVEQTLQFAAGKADYRPRNVEFLRVEDVVNHVLAEASAIIDASGFTVEKNIDADLPKIRVNVATFSECLLNLIGNALKYGAQSQWIGIHARPFETGRGTGVRITIEDRGPGIPDEELSQIFEPFFRGRDARAAQIRGTGLGLSLAQEAAATMGARITVESVVGMGSIFTIHMPASYLNSSTIPVEAIVES